MILHFPDLDAFRLAVTAGVVPPSAVAAACEASFGEDGGLTVKPKARLTKAHQGNLKKLGVEPAKAHLGDAVALDSWVQVVPLEASPQPPQSTQSPVLFEVADPADLPGLVTEMLRLGNDRQSYRWFETKAGPQRVLLRVIGPPYYTLLRALDRLAPDGGEGEPLRAYLEHPNRVWTEVGFRHPLIEHIQAPDGQIVLLRPEREWDYFDDGTFHDIYQILKFEMPGEAVEWKDARRDDKLEVPLRLVPGNATDRPELWVMREGGVDQLDALVRDADEQLLGRLSFAVAQPADAEPTVLLRVRPGVKSPPALSPERAVGFKPYWKLPNLFLPAGSRLQPTLRRERVRSLLADDPDQVVWLYPDGGGEFTPESLPDTAFRPLADWVEYVIDGERRELGEWVEATRFDFDGFVCKDDGTPRGDGGGPGKGKKAPEREVGPPPAESGGKSGGRKRKPKAAQAEAYAAEPEEVPKPAEPSEWETRRKELEQEFLAVEGPLDDAARVDLWPHLAEANARLGDRGDGAVCWVNAIWEAGEVPADWAADWVTMEVGRLPRSLDRNELDRQLNDPVMSPDTARGVAAQVVWGALNPRAAETLKERMPKLREYLESNERLLSVRAAWLAWTGLGGLAGADVLGLARVRDRLLKRLLDNGLHPERDLPSFLRFAGEPDEDRLRRIRDRVPKLREAARGWTERGESGPNSRVTAPYVDLMFAYALARLREESQSRELVEAARRELTPRKNPAADFLFKGFVFRIEQAVAGKALAGSLSTELKAEYDKLAGTERYTVRRLRQRCRLLEPVGSYDPYLDSEVYSSGEVFKTVAGLIDVDNPSELRRRIEPLLAGKSFDKLEPPTRVRLLAKIFEFGDRFDQALAEAVTERVLPALSGSAGASDKEFVKDAASMLERAALLMGHFGRPAVAKEVIAACADWAGSLPPDGLFEAINRFVGRGVRNMRRLGLREDFDALLDRLSDGVRAGGTVERLRKQDPDRWRAALQSMVLLSSRWVVAGEFSKAEPILDEARNELFRRGALFPKGPRDSKVCIPDYANLAKAYISVLGSAPAEDALARLENLFKNMDPLENQTTTSSICSQFHLFVIDEAVRSVVSEEFIVGSESKRWLDDDEFLVRRRIHRDMSARLAESGL